MLLQKLKKHLKNLMVKHGLKHLSLQEIQHTLQMLNRYMEFLKQSKEFDFDEVKIIEKELVEPETGTVSKYNVKEIN